MYSCGDTPKGWVAPFGYPRIKACSRLPVAFRSVPRPSSPPGAKASTECPSLAQDAYPRTLDPRIHHAQKPSSGISRQLSVVGCQKQPPPELRTSKPKNDPVLDHLDSVPPGLAPRLRRGTTNYRWHAHNTRL